MSSRSMVREAENAMTRERLARNSSFRAQAVCEYPMRVYKMCEQLSLMISMFRFTDPPPSTQSLMRELEEQICREFEKSFGHSMFAEINEKGE